MNALDIDKADTIWHSITMQDKALGVRKKMDKSDLHLKMTDRYVDILNWKLHTKIDF